MVFIPTVNHQHAPTILLIQRDSTNNVWLSAHPLTGALLAISPGYPNIVSRDITSFQPP